MFDLTPAFVDCGADVDELLVYRVGEIVLIRGTTADPTKAAEPGRIATFLGYDVGGRVGRESQKVLAIEILLKVAGAKQVQWIDGESRITVVSKGFSC